MPDDDLHPVARLHNEVARADDAGVASTRPSGTTATELQRMVADVITKLDLGPEQAVCEIGCGTGVLARPIAARVRRFVGVDFAGEALAVLGEHFEQDGTADRATLLCLDVLGDDVGPLTALGPFDRVLVYATFHYVPDDAAGARFLETIVQLLAPGGLALVGNLPLQDLADERAALRQVPWPRRLMAGGRWLLTEPTPVPRGITWKLRAVASTARRAVARRRSRRSAGSLAASSATAELPAGSVVPLRIATLERALADVHPAVEHRWAAPQVGVPLFADRADLLLRRPAGR
jgi:SAM-dependent methyltransferase